MAIYLGAGLRADPTNPVLANANEATLLMDGDQLDMWYRRLVNGSMQNSLTYAFANDSGRAKWGLHPVNPVLAAANFGFPSILKVGSTYYCFALGASGHIYLYASTNKLTWAVQNSGNPVLQHSANPADWWFALSNVSVAVVGSQWHMLIEGHSQSGTPHLGYSVSTLGALNWTANVSPIVLEDAGNPCLMYVPERNALFGVIGDRRLSRWRILGAWASLSSNLTQIASWTRSLFPLVYEANNDIADPCMVETNVPGRRLILSYNYRQADLHQAYSPMTMTDFFDATFGTAVAALP